MMKSTLTWFAASLALSACSPNYPAPEAQTTGTCRNHNCTIDGKPSQEFFSKFMTGVVGSCADQANMSFTSMVANFVSPKSNTGFAEIRLFVDPVNGTYKGAYATTADGEVAPTIQSFDGKYFLENSAIVLEGLGIGHKNTADELLIQVLTSSKLDIAFSPQISFVQDMSPVNDKGETVAQVCAAQTVTQTPPSGPSAP